MGLRQASFERAVTLSNAGLEEDIQAALPRFAREERGRLIGAGQASSVYRTFVNGRADLPEESVQVPGPIVYEFSYVTEAVIFCLAFLKQRSPRLSGAYKESITALIDKNTWDQASEIDADAEVLVMSNQPYSRKIQVGSKGFETSKGIYEQARQAVMTRFQAIVEAQVTFVQIVGGASLKSGGPLTYPAVRIKARR